MLLVALFFSCARDLHQSAPSHFLKTIAEYIAFCNVIWICKILAEMCFFLYIWFQEKGLRAQNLIAFYNLIS